MFDSHPDIAVPGESYFITGLLPRLAAYEKEGFDAARFVEDVVAFNWTSRPEEPTWIDRWKIDRALLRNRVVEAAPKNYADAVRSVFRCFADWKGKSVYGDKTPAYITSIETIAELLPEARFVHLVRDGRDVALAFLAASFGPSSVEEVALHWRARVLAGLEAGSRLGPASYMELKYEDLVANPEASLRRVCDWLAVPYSSRMLEHQESAKAITLGFKKAHHHVQGPIRKGLRDWRKDMTESAVERFELIAGDALEAFGYERARRNPRIGRRAVVGARRSYLEVKKLSRRIRGLSSGDWW